MKESSLKLEPFTQVRSQQNRCPFCNLLLNSLLPMSLVGLKSKPCANEHYFVTLFVLLKSPDFINLLYYLFVHCLFLSKIQFLLKYRLDPLQVIKYVIAYSLSLSSHSHFPLSVYFVNLFAFRLLFVGFVKQHPSLRPFSSLFFHALSSN